MRARVVAQRMAPAWASGAAKAPGRASTRRAWLVAFLAFFLLGAGWASAMPYDGPPDELQHVIRAYGVADGQYFAGSSNSKVVTAVSLFPEKSVGCFRWDASVSAACLGAPSSGPQDTRLKMLASSGASGYDPSYYLLVGQVIHALPTMTGVVLARLLTAAEVSAFLAFAVAIAWSTRRGRWLLPGVLVGVTPVVAGLLGAVNPAGVEIGAAVAFWVGLIDLSGPGRPRRWVVAVVGASGVVFAVTRGFGPGWLLVVAAVCALSLDRAKARELMGSALVRGACAVIAVACVAGVAWDVAAGPNYPMTAPTKTKLSAAELIAEQLWDRIPYYIDGTVRLTSYGNVVVPPVVGYVWLAFVALLVLGGLVVGSRRTRVQMVATMAIALGMLMSADMNATRQNMWFSQGRYALPILVGVPILGAAALGRADVLTADRHAALLRWMAVALLPLHLVTLYVTMLRFQDGLPQDGHLPVPLNVLHGRWLPLYGPVVPILTFCLGLAVLAVAAWRAPSALRLLPSTPPILQEADPRAGSSHRTSTSAGLRS